MCPKLLDFPASTIAHFLLVNIHMCACSHRGQNSTLGIFSNISLRVWEEAHTCHGACMDSKDHPHGVRSFFPLCTPWGLDSRLSSSWGSACLCVERSPPKNTTQMWIQADKVFISQMVTTLSVQDPSVALSLPQGEPLITKTYPEWTRTLVKNNSQPEAKLQKPKTRLAHLGTFPELCTLMD